MKQRKMYFKNGGKDIAPQNLNCREKANEAITTKSHSRKDQPMNENITS